MGGVERLCDHMLSALCKGRVCVGGCYHKVKLTRFWVNPRSLPFGLFDSAWLLSCFGCEGAQGTHLSTQFTDRDAARL